MPMAAFTQTVAAVVRPRMSPFAAQDRAAAEKADAGDDLRRDARGIAAVPSASWIEIEREGRGAERDQRVRAEAGGALPHLALRAEDRAEHRREQQPAERVEFGDQRRPDIDLRHKPPRPRSLSGRLA